MAPPTPPVRFHCLHNQCCAVLTATSYTELLTHISNYHRDIPPIIDLQCPRCNTTLYRIDRTKNYSGTLKRGWNHLADRDNECPRVEMERQLLAFNIRPSGDATSVQR
nr:hypothetical protein [Salmonid herpesvirus 1]